MRVKISGIRNEADLQATACSGVDAIGFLLGQVHPSSDFILPGTAARLVRLLPPGISPVIVTHLTVPEEILDLSDRTGILTIQLHGGSSPEEVRVLRDTLPPSAKLVVTIHLDEDTDFVKFKDYYSVASAFLVDSYDESTGRVGSTGKSNNWTLAARFVQESPLPVILAGGLSPENVVQVFQDVRPYGVDACTAMKNKKTGAIDPEICTQFVQAAHGCI